jgi:hypothetical protein
MVEEKINLFLEELENRGIEITGETAFICNDGAVLFAPNERGAVDITLVRNPIKIDYDLGITDSDIEMWKTTADLMQELGGGANGGDR